MNLSGGLGRRTALGHCPPQRPAGSHGLCLQPGRIIAGTGPPRKGGHRQEGLPRAEAHILDRDRECRHAEVRGVPETGLSRPQVAPLHGQLAEEIPAVSERAGVRDRAPGPFLRFGQVPAG